MVTTDQSSLAAQLRLAIARTARRLRQEGGWLSPTLGAAMSTIERYGPLTPSELASRERIQRPTATRLIARLEQDGLIIRTPDPVDRRSCMISVSPTGAAELKTARTRKDAFLEARLAQLSAEDRATIARAADLLEELLQA